MDKAAFFREARQDIPGPLAGVRVVEATTTWAGPMCACLLADLGADVIKIELPAGEVIRRMQPFLPGTNPPVSLGQAIVNRNKRSLSLDLRRPEGRDVFLQLAAQTDIVVENFRPGTMDAWGIGYEAVRRVKADVIYVSISGFGQFGPDHERAGYDPLAESASGFLSVNGEPNGNPVKAATGLADDLAGLHAALAAVSAMHYRSQTGEGQHIDVALLDSMLFQSNWFLTMGALGMPIQRWGNAAPFAVPAEVYACRDGHVYIAVLLDAHWQVLARLLGRAELAEDPAYSLLSNRVQRRAELDALVSEWCASRTVEEVESLFLEAGLPIAPVRNYAQVAGNAHVRERDMLQETRQADGSVVPITGPAAKFSRTPTRVRTGAPALGAHDDEILQGLGLSASDIADLREKGVVVQG
jgi:formyl-CoA transferase